mmetsp:Transcript_52299/g.152002  ORF Transcript_52299/g.152002 Transcript_52299/m.152002 type:complete len:462 (-) Transcript_52299:121-1506(-)
MRLGGLSDDLLHLLALEGVPAEDPAHVLGRDGTGVVGVKPVEGGVEQAVVQGHAAVEHRRKEVGVLHLRIIIEVQRMKDVQHLFIRNAELPLQGILQLPECNGAMLVLVHGQEVLPDHGTFLFGQAPGHDFHAAAAEPGGAAELAQRFDHESIHLDPRPLAPALDPRVAQRLLRREPRLRVHSQQRPREVLGVLGNVLPQLWLHGVLALSDPLELHGRRAREGHMPSQEYEDDDPQAPQVALAGVAPRQHLRSGIRKCPKPLPHLGIGRQNLAEAEIDHLQVAAPLRLEQEVLQLQVTVNHAMAVDVIQRQEDLPHRLRRIGFSKDLLLLHPLVQLPTLHALHDEVQVFVRNVHVVQSRNVGVVHAQEDLRLRPQPRPVLGREAGQPHLLDGVTLGTRRVGLAFGKLHNAVATRAEYACINDVVILDSPRGTVVPAQHLDLVVGAAFLQVNERGRAPPPEA